MMKIQEVFKALQYGELSQVALGGGPAGTIQEADYPKLLSHLQLGLTALHKRFNIRQDKYPLSLVLGTKTYTLPVSVLKVEKVHTAEGKELALNQEGNEYSVHTPRNRVLELPDAIADQGPDLPDVLKTTGLVITHRSNHAAIDPDFFDLDTEIDLPETFLEPLLYYIAARVHNPIGSIGQSNEGQVGVSWSARYEASCKEIENKGLDTTPHFSQDRMARGGWV